MIVKNRRANIVHQKGDNTTYRLLKKQQKYSCKSPFFCIDKPSKGYYNNEYKRTNVRYISTEFLWKGVSTNVSQGVCRCPH